MAGLIAGLLFSYAAGFVLIFDPQLIMADTAGCGFGRACNVLGVVGGWGGFIS